MTGEYALNQGILLVFTIYFSVWDIKCSHLYMRDIAIFYLWIALSYLYLYTCHLPIAHKGWHVIALICMMVYLVHHILEERLHLYWIGRGDILYLIGLLWIFPVSDVLSILLLSALFLFLASLGLLCYAFYKGKDIRKYKIPLMPFLCLSLCFIQGLQFMQYRKWG